MGYLQAIASGLAPGASAGGCSTRFRTTAIPTRATARLVIKRVMIPVMKLVTTLAIKRAPINAVQIISFHVM